MALTKEALRKELYRGRQLAFELLYTTYSGMLYGFVLQFVPDEPKAKDLLTIIFSRLTPRLEEACDSRLSIYCWLQVEARKIILPIQKDQNSHAALHGPKPFTAASGQNKATYFSLLEDASPEHQEVFSRLFLYGDLKEDLAIEIGKDPVYVDRLLKESLLIIRKRLACILRTI